MTSIRASERSSSCYWRILRESSSQKAFPRLCLSVFLKTDSKLFLESLLKIFSIVDISFALGWIFSALYDAQLAIAEGFPPAGRKIERDHQILGEYATWSRHGKPVGQLQIGGFPLVI